MIYKFGTPEKCLNDFLIAWQKSDAEKMFNLCQKSWRKNHKGHGENYIYFILIQLLFGDKKTRGDYIALASTSYINSLKKNISKWKLFEFIIGQKTKPFKTNIEIKIKAESIGVDKNVMVDFEVFLSGEFYIYNQENNDFEKTDIEKKIITTIRLIRENKKGEPCIYGNWGVNPISILRTEDIPEKELDEIKNKFLLCERGFTITKENNGTASNNSTEIKS